MKYIAACALLLVNTVLAAYEPDEIINLPALDFKLNFKQYSGYLEIGGGKHFHYWFVESQKNASTDPLVLWLNGGPGCSSMDGLLSENGPFTVKNGVLVKNDYSWNKIANVLYLESPAGVGFSYSDTQAYATDDDQVSLDNYMAIQKFLEKFPEYRENDFHITGESYGGIYVPTLSVRVYDGKDTFPINFKGFAIGNGLLSWEYNDNSLMFYTYHHGLFGYRLWESLVDLCCEDIPTKYYCNFYNPSSQDCQDKVAEANNVMNPDNLLNIYNIYQKCLTPNHTLSGVQKPSPVSIAKKNLLRNSKQSHLLRNTGTAPVGLDPPCTDSSEAHDWLNRDDVRHALHISKDAPEWEICSAEVNTKYTRIYQDMKAQFDHLSHLKNMVYYGDVDIACNYLGAQWFVESLGRKVVSEYAAWLTQPYQDQIAGFVKKFENLTFVTVKGSGHMVPEDKPSPAFTLFDNFLNDKGF